MSDDKTPTDDHSAEPADHDSNGAGESSKAPVPPAVALGFVIIALLGVLIVMGIKGGLLGGSSSSNNADMVKLKAEVDARRNELNRQRAMMGLAPLAGTSEPIEDIAKRLKSDADTLVALAGRFQEMLAEKDSELSAKSAEVLRSEQLRQSLTAENQRLNTELSRALIGGSDADRLRNDLANMKSQRDALAAELTSTIEKMKTMSAGVSEDEFADLKRRYEETLRAKEFFEARVHELEGDLSKAKLFASNENELLPAAVELFRSLRELEGLPDSEISKAYSSLGAKLGANVMQTLSFVTGSSELSAPDQETLRNIAADMPNGDLLLVIGYASETGNVDSNRKLSSARATAAAEFYSTVKRPDQLVQAVYLGQTDRFSSRIPERNQIVEVWRIRKK
jgi:outer membrane protein OmpA-like peptidoglycan-associated protein